MHKHTKKMAIELNTKCTHEKYGKKTDVYTPGSRTRERKMEMKRSAENAVRNHFECSAKWKIMYVLQAKHEERAERRKKNTELEYKT